MKYVAKMLQAFTDVRAKKVEVGGADGGVRQFRFLPEGESWEPPRPTDGPHAEGNIQAWAVAKEGGEDGFETEAEIQRLVRHSLLENRVLTRLRDD